MTLPHQEPIYVVSGLPRSGTSMMMRMLEAGGLSPLVDGIRQADDDNPRGYYELEKVKQLPEDASWLHEARGRVIKVISELLQHLPPDHRYRVIFMRRPLEEILRSQRRMLERRGVAEAADDAAMRRMFVAHLASTEEWLRSQAHLDVLFVSYTRTVEDPAAGAARVRAFLGDHLRLEPMVAAVEAALYRQRR